MNQIKTTKILEVPCDLAIPLLGMYPEKTIIRKNSYTPVFIVALFKIAKTWEQLKCPSTDESLSLSLSLALSLSLTHIHTHTMEYYAAIKRNEILPFAAKQLDPEIIIMK